MNILKRFGAVLLAPLMIAGSAFAQQFAPGNMLVIDRTKSIFEFNSAGTFVRKLPTGAILDVPISATFGPNGHLFVGSDSNDRIVEFDNSFAFVRDFGVGEVDVVSGLEFGPNGVLYAGSLATDKIVLYNSTGAKISDFAAASGLDLNFDIQFLPDGHVLVANLSSANISELSNAGTFVKKIGTTLADSLTMTPRGTILATTSSPASQFMEFDGGGNLLGTFGLANLVASGFPFGAALGPNDRLVAANINKITVFNNQHQFLFDIADANNAFGLTSDVIFVPYRFEANLTGVMHKNDGTNVKIKEKVRISYAPGTPKCFIEFIDGPSAIDLSSLFSATAWDFHGTEVPVGTGDKQRGFVGTQVGRVGLRDGVGSLDLQISGKRDANKSFVISKIKGSCSQMFAGGQFTGKLASTKLIK